MKWISTLVLGALLLAGCAPKGGDADGAGASGGRGEKGKGGAYLAYIHAVSIDTAEAQVQPLYERLIAACKAEPADACTLLDSSISGGREVGARLSFRASPAGVQRLIGLAASGGALAERSTRVEDLAGPIVDSNKRLEMLKQYQLKLQELERRAGRDVDALIKVSRELASVQSELEQATGDNARLMLRVNQDVLNVTLGTRLQRSFWAPVRHALGDFSANLSAGLSGAITGFAYGLPWLLAFLLLFPLARKGWRRMRGA